MRVRKDRVACRLGAVVSLHIPPTGQDRALSAAQDFGVVSSFAGETDIVGQTSPQGAEAMRQWQGRVMGAVEPSRLVRGVRSAKAIRHRPGAFAEVFASRRT
jgi:hypothetical protein